MADRPPADVTAGQPPPASFEFLVQTLFTQALMALGKLPNPITNQTHRNLATARHFVDTLAMLESKTRGNLDADEQRHLEQAQHHLRTLVLGEKP